MTEAVLELYGHSRRVGLIEWHPTSSGILFSAGYDYKVAHQNHLDAQVLELQLLGCVFSHQLLPNSLRQARPNPIIGFRAPSTYIILAGLDRS